MKSRASRPVAALAAAAAFLVLAAPAFGQTLIVDDDGRASPPANCDAPTPAPSSIEAAVEAAPPGATINVCPGTYVEQVSFETDDNGTTIRSLVRRAAVIKAPATIGADVLNDKAIVNVNGATGVRILAFTITGPGPANCDSIRYGVYVKNGGEAAIDDNHITEIRDVDPAGLTPGISGCQNGVGIQVGRMIFATTGRALITRNLIDRYQKNGMTIDNAGSVATVIGNRVRGFGPVQSIAQNGIQVSRGAYANVRLNEVSGNTLVGPLEALASSSGILLYGYPTPAPGTTVAWNYVHSNDDNIPAFGVQLARILENRVLSATRYDGIYMSIDSAQNRIEGNYLRNNTEHDCHDESFGPGTAGTANLWIANDGETQNRPGLCEGARGDDDDDPEDDEDGEDDDDDDRDGADD